MARTTVQLTEQLRDLIRLTRKESAHLTQRSAARAAGYSTVWWRHIESGQQPEAMVDTLARMCYVIGIPPASLRAVGFPDVAAEVEKRQELLGGGEEGTPYKDELEAYLWHAPADKGTKRALIAHLRLLREVGGDPAAAAVMKDLRNR